jgi:hypothetical protein
MLRQAIPQDSSLSNELAHHTSETTLPNRNSCRICFQGMDSLWHAACIVMYRSAKPMILMKRVTSPAPDNLAASMFRLSPTFEEDI